MTKSQKRGIEAPRPEELRALAQLLEQLAEINQRLARSQVMLTKVERPSDSDDEPISAAGPQDPPLDAAAKI